MHQIQYPELGFYTLPGHVDSAADIFEEVAKGEELGFGSVWISERLSTKEIGVLSGIALGQSKHMGIASGLIGNLTLRHPLVVAGYASTMMTLSRGRFALGMGKGIEPLADAAGVPRLNFNLLAEYVGLLRRLWRGEAIDYDGPLGRMRGLRLGAPLDPEPPILMAAMGPKAAYWAGRFCDGVILDSLWSQEAVAQSTRLVRQGAADAGRDPARVRVWTILLTACETPEEVVLQTVIRRINTYLLFPKLFDLICDANGWQKHIAARIRADVVQMSGSSGAGSNGDEHVSSDLEDLRKSLAMYPKEWIRDGCAVGGAAACAQAASDRFAAGADGVIFHGTSPANLTPLLKVWPQYRPEKQFNGRSTNPGL